MTEMIFELPLNLLKLTLQHPSTSRVKLTLVTITYPILLIIVLSTVLTQLFHKEADVESSVKNVLAFGAYSEMLGKFIVYRVYRQELYKLIDSTRFFWKTDRCRTMKLKLSLDELLIKTIFAQKLFACSLGFFTVLMLIFPVVTKQPPVAVWYGRDYKFSVIVIVLHEIGLALGVAYIIAYDGIYLSFCMELVLQFKMLNSLLEELQFFQLDKLKSCVEQHKFLLQFIEKLKEIYSPVLFIQFSAITLILCAEMFAFFDSTNTRNSIYHLLRTLLIAGQLFIYSLPLDYITDEASTLSKMVYNCNWYTNYVPFLKNTVMLIMQRSQLDIVFKAGGLFEVNSRAILTVFKYGWSICMVMRGLKK